MKMAAQSRTYLLVVGDSGPQQWYYCDLEHIRSTKWGKKICYERRIGINFHNYLHPLFHQLWRCWYLQMCKRDPLLSAIPKSKSDTNRVFQWQEQPGNYGILCIVGQSLILLGYNKCVLDFFTFFFFFSYLSLVQVKVLNEMSTIGKISKYWSGFVNNVFTNTANFGIQVPVDLDVKIKAVMIGACFLIVSMKNQEVVSWNWTACGNKGTLAVSCDHTKAYMQWKVKPLPGG